MDSELTLKIAFEPVSSQHTVREHKYALVHAMLALRDAGYLARVEPDDYSVSGTAGKTVLTMSAPLLSLGLPDVAPPAAPPADTDALGAMRAQIAALEELVGELVREKGQLQIKNAMLVGRSNAVTRMLTDALTPAAGK